MDTRLQTMLDHFEIRQTLSDYCFGCDRSDEARMAAVYAEDSWDNHGVYSGPGRSFAKEMTQAIIAVTDSLSHMLGQSQIKVDGDVAGAETYFIAASHATAADGTVMCNQLGGRFVDRLERTTSGWLIKDRVVVRDWSISMPVDADWTAENGLTEGRRSNEDPAFAALGLTHSAARLS